MTLREIFGALGVLVGMLGLIGLCVVSLFQLPVEERARLCADNWQR